MRLPLLAATALFVGCAAPTMGGGAGFDEPDAGREPDPPSHGAEDAGAAATYDAGVPADEQGCPLSDLGTAVHEAVMASNAAESLVPMTRVLARWNDAEGALVEGPEIFPRLGELIAAADEEVDFATFVWEVSSDPSNEILDALVRLEGRLAAEGPRDEPVQVRLFVNANRLAGAEDVARPLVESVDALELDPQYVVVTVATRESWAFGAMHQKLVVIDGAVAHLGGANVEYVHGWNGVVPWHDTAYVVRGEIARALLRSFDDLWVEGRTWRCESGVCDTTANERIDRSGLEVTRASTCMPMIALTKRPRGGVNNDVDSPQDQGYLAAMAAAREHIQIESPNLNDDAAKQAILDAVARGVAVRIVLSLGFNEMTESLPGQGGGNAANVEELYAEATEAVGAEEACRLLQIRWYARDASGPIEGNGEGASHTKYMSIDDRLVIVGSGNMDTQTWNHSGEVNVAIDDEATTRAFDARVFSSDFSRAFPAACPL